MSQKCDNMFAFILSIIFDEQVKETQILPCALRLDVAALGWGAGLSLELPWEGWCPHPGDSQFAVMLTLMSPEKVATAGGPHPGADIPHLFQGREPKLLLLSFLFMCQSIRHSPGEKGTPCVSMWHIAFGKHSSVESLTIL